MYLVSLLVVILVLGLVFAIVLWIIDQIPAFAPFKMVARAIVGLIAIVVLLGIILGGVSVPVLTLR